VNQAIATMLKNVEIEVNSRCNRKCSYCPVSVLSNSKLERWMSDFIFERIHDELLKIDYQGRISYHFYNEPLLRRDLERFITYSHERLPGAHQVLFTNGDLLTDARYESLMSAGIEYIVITSHDGKPHPKRLRQIVQFPGDLDLTNRGGTMTTLPAATAEDHLQPCFAPSEMLIVTVAGDVLLCYEDAERMHSFGNLQMQTLEEIWFAPILVALRDKLERGNRLEAASICACCTNHAHTKAGKSARSEPFWELLDIPLMP
jgi:cyclic pyranopterin phosphate synthase